MTTSSSSRRSSRFFSTTVSSDSGSESEASLSGESVASTDSTSKQWKSLALNKYVYFRWSTAHSSQNRFKGLITGYKAKCKLNRRVDYLIIKTIGMSEDTYVVGKDVREFYVLPSKSALMDAKDEEAIRQTAIRKWTWRDGWVNKGKREAEQLVDEKPRQKDTLVDELKSEQLKPMSISVSQAPTAPGTPVVAVRPKTKKKKAERPLHPVDLPPLTTTLVSSRHTFRGMAGRIKKFAFAKFN
jgi:hypothetical protein